MSTANTQSNPIGLLERHTSNPFEGFERSRSVAPQVSEAPATMSLASLLARPDAHYPLVFANPQRSVEYKLRGGDPLNPGHWQEKMLRGLLFSNGRQAESLEEQLYDARAKAKALSSQFAMHITAGDRERLFKNLDRLHDLDEWPEGEPPLLEGSYRTFLRLFLWIGASRFPSLGLTTTGNLLAIWGRPHDSVTVECLVGDRLRWVIDHVVNGEREVASAETSLARFKDTISPYKSQGWFGA